MPVCNVAVDLGGSCGIIGLVVEYIVAIDVTRVRFPDDAPFFARWSFSRLTCFCQRPVTAGLSPPRSLLSVLALSKFRMRASGIGMPDILRTFHIISSIV